MSKITDEMVTRAMHEIGLYPLDRDEVRTALAAVYPLIEKQVREECARVAEPKRGRPCGCDICDCQNSGDLRDVSSWDEASAIAAAIRALGEKP